MRIYIASRRKKLTTISKEFEYLGLKREYYEAEIIDVTLKSSSHWVKFSPFYPHGNIPVPFSSELSQSIQGVWEALKVFKSADIDLKKLRTKNMRGVTRTVRKNGELIGYRKGVHGTKLLQPLEARTEIFIDSYNWMLINNMQEQIDVLIKKAKKGGVILLDDTINTDVSNLDKPLSHAGLLRQYILEEENMKYDSSHICPNFRSDSDFTASKVELQIGNIISCINELPLCLQKILDCEFKKGNAVNSGSRGWPYKNSVFIGLNKKFHKKYDLDSSAKYTERPHPHFGWLEYACGSPESILACPVK